MCRTMKRSYLRRLHVRRSLGSPTADRIHLLALTNVDHDQSDNVGPKRCSARRTKVEAISQRVHAGAATDFLRSHCKRGVVCSAGSQQDVSVSNVTAGRRPSRRVTSRSRDSRRSCEIAQPPCFKYVGRIRPSIWRSSLGSTVGFFFCCEPGRRPGELRPFARSCPADRACPGDDAADRGYRRPRNRCHPTARLLLRWRAPSGAWPCLRGRAWRPDAPCRAQRR